MPTPLAVTTSDGLTLEAELAKPADDDTHAAFVLCHPHPQFGGTMRSLVISALFEALPAAGIACLRFNFRGVEASSGAFDDGTGERLDALAAIDTLADAVDGSTPMVLTGWSFGGDVALSTSHDRVDAWYAIAPPLRFAETAGIAHDPRRKLIALAEHDEIRAPSEVAHLFAGWSNTDVEIVPGASHFFVERSDRLVELALGLAASF